MLAGERRFCFVVSDDYAQSVHTESDPFDNGFNVIVHPFFLSRQDLAGQGGFSPSTWPRSLCGAEI